jgi:Carbohydrate esterase, sialic acid-specific acetylesterase
MPYWGRKGMTATLPVGGGYNSYAMLVSGQSNAIGQVFAPDLPGYLSGTNSNIQIYTGSSFQALQNSVNNDTLENQNPGSWGLEAQFSYLFAQSFPTKKLYILKYAIDSTTLATNWNPGITNNDYASMKTYAAQAMTALLAIPGVNLSPEQCLCWMQGESDAFNSTTANAYATELPAFIASVKTDWMNSQSRVVVGRISQSTALTYSAAVRSAQAATALPDQWISTDSYPLQGDNFHYTAAGIISLGQDMFNAAVTAGFGS